MCSLGGMDDISFIFVLLIESDSRTEKKHKGKKGSFGGDSGRSVRSWRLTSNASCPLSCKNLRKRSCTNVLYSC